MGKSLLSCFEGDFNRTIGIFPKVETKNNIGEQVFSWDTASETGIKCFLINRNQEYNRFIEKEVEYLKTTHKIRLYFGLTIKVGDKVRDEFDTLYDVKFIQRVPGFDGEDDHLSLLVDIVETNV